MAQQIMDNVTFRVIKIEKHVSPRMNTHRYWVSCKKLLRVEKPLEEFLSKLRY